MDAVERPSGLQPGDRRNDLPKLLSSCSPHYESIAQEDETGKTLVLTMTATSLRWKSFQTHAKIVDKGPENPAQYLEACMSARVLPETDIQ